MGDLPRARYQAFLSHNSADRPAVEELARRLETDGISCFLDKWHLIPGQTWQPALEEALGQSESCVVFVGPSGLGPWQNEEMRAAIARRVSTASHRVVPVLLPGAQREQRSRLPDFLVSATWVEFSSSTGEADAFHRLKCGIRGMAPGPSPGEALFEGECPYRGLQVFEADQMRFFFGRDAEVDWILDRLATNFGTPQEGRFLGVVGASGSGKSSLVRAGLIPALREGRSRSGKSVPGSAEWPIVVFKPGADPLKSLADALWSNDVSRPIVTDPPAFARQLLEDQRRLHWSIETLFAQAPDTRRFMVVVDQFEEIFTQCPTEAEPLRAAFINNLMYATSAHGGRTLVVATMRADFYGLCSRYGNLAHALSDRQELVPPLGPADLRAAIVQPAQLCGLELEPGLTELLLQDMREQPAGALPLLQQTLLMLWDRRSGRRLTIQAYREIGEIEGALESHANQIYEQGLRSDEERSICRRVLLMLTTPGEGTEDTRRRVPRSQLGSSDAVDAVLQQLVKGRLVTLSESDPPRVEVTHEALIRGWKQLRSWLDEDRESLRILHRLVDAAEEWETHQRDPAFLYAGSRLLQAEDWRAKHARELADIPLAGEFIDAAVDLRDAEKNRREAEEQQRLEIFQNLAETERSRAEVQAHLAATERQQKKRLRVMLGIVGALSGIASTVGFQAYQTASDLKVQKGRAETNAVLAEERAKSARVEQLFALAAQNFAEHERVLARSRAADVGSDDERALTAIAPKYLSQSKRYHTEAQELLKGLDVWRRTQGITVPIPETLFTLESFQAEMGTAFLVHYGSPMSPRRILIDGGPFRTYRRVLKPRLEALRTDDTPLQIDLAISTQTDIQHLQGLIDLVNDLQQQPADKRTFNLNAVWSNAFVPGPPEEAQRLAEIYEKGQFVAGARALGVPVNVPFTRMVAAPEAGVARVSFEQDLTITILAPRIQRLRDFADFWLRGWQQRADARGVDVELYSMLTTYDILETFADERIELRPSPIEIVEPLGGGGNDKSVINLASTVLMLEVSGKRMLLPADARADTILSALGQGGYTDEHGNVDVDVLILPHGGSDSNVTVGFFQSVKARYYVISADGTYGNPEVKTLKMLFDGRRSDKRPFSIALTYLPEEYKSGYPIGDLYKLLTQERNAGTPFEIVTPKKGQSSFGIDLCSPATFVDKGTLYVAPSL